MAGLFEGLGGDLTNPGAEIGRGIARAMQEKNAKQLLAEINQRETLAKRFEEIEQDRSYDQQARDAARNYSMQLRMLPPTDKRPKEFLPDKKFEKELGVSGIEATPAWVRVTLRKRQKDGPKEPAQPQEPADPSMELSAPPSIGAIAESAPPVMPVAGMGPDIPMIPPMPGGEQLGPNQITTAPAIPGAPAELAPPPSIGEEYVSTRRDLREMAQEEAELASIRNSLPVDPALAESLGLPPGTTSINPVVLQNFRLTADRQARLLARGFNEDGTPLPWKQALDEARINLQNAQAEAQQAIAAGKPEEAAIKLLQANAAMLSAQASMERAQNPQAFGGSGTFFPVTNERGEIIGGVNNKSWQTVPPPDIPGARKSGAPAAALDKQAALDATLQSLDELEKLGNDHSDVIGPISGRITALKKETIGTEAGVNELFRIADDIADQLLRARSGAAITEGEYARLRRLVPDPRSPIEKFRSDLAGYRKEALRMKDARASVGTAPEAPPPAEQRVAGVTKAMIGGVERVWTGTSWARIK